MAVSSSGNQTSCERWSIPLYRDRFVAWHKDEETLAFWDSDFTSNVIYQKLLTDKLTADLGYVYENIVSQMLVAAGKKLYYHTWPTEDGKRNYEVDFLIPDGGKVSVIEVKSSQSKKHYSIDNFMQKYSSRIQQSYLIHGKDIRKDGALKCLPFYMTQFL